RRGVDAADARVRMRRAQDRRIGLARQADVVAVTAVAAHQPQVFLAAKRLSDGLRHWRDFGGVGSPNNRLRGRRAAYSGSQAAPVISEHWFGRKKGNLVAA